jgi:hypothetical protein
LNRILDTLDLVTLELKNGRGRARRRRRRHTDAVSSTRASCHTKSHTPCRWRTLFCVQSQVTFTVASWEDSPCFSDRVTALGFIADSKYRCNAWLPNCDGHLMEAAFNACITEAHIAKGTIHDLGPWFDQKLRSTQLITCNGEIQSKPWGQVEHDLPERQTENYE